MRLKSRKKRTQEKNLKYGVQEKLFYTVDDFMDVIIDRGIESFMNDVEREITELCGKRYKHIAERRFTRWGSANSSLVLGGKKIKIKHPRVRNVETNKEREIEILEHFKFNDVLTKKQMEQMILGVSTRKYKRSLEASSKKFPGFGTSKSSVSRGFIAQTISKLNAWLSKPIEEDYPIIMLDGLEVKKRTILIAVGIKIGGKKDILGARDGSTENSRICIDLLQDLIERGLDPSKVKLVVIDGGTGLRKAVNDVFGKTFLIQRCQLHKKRNVTENLPPHKRDTIWNAMSEAYKNSSYKTAKRLLNNLIDKLEKEEPRAAASLKEGLEETLTLLRMKCPKKLQKSLATTNPIESMNGGIRHVIKRVKHWKDDKMRMRWVLTGILETEKNFRRINGYQNLPLLINMIDNELNLNRQMEKIAI